MEQYGAVILAAGKGTRMKSNSCKVLHTVAGKPMLGYVIDAVRNLRLEKICLVVGHQAQDVIDRFGDPDLNFVLQEPQLGTGHAVKQCSNVFEGFRGHVLIMCGDTPLVTHQVLYDFISFHESRFSKLTVLTTRLENPYGYGRVQVDDHGMLMRIVEEKDADQVEKLTKEINTGFYLVESQLLFELLENLKTENAQREYYLTDLISEAHRANVTPLAFHTDYNSVVLGVNSRNDLAKVNALMWNRIRTQFMEDGVTLLDPETFYPDFGVTVGLDTTICPNVMISGNSSIGETCYIEPGCVINDSSIGNRVKILSGSKLDNVEVDSDVSIGPMAHLRPETRICRDVKIGNFVEIKKTSVGIGSKASHLTYLGDCEIGEGVNIGCGTITCNYDGKTKHATIIGDNCFVGSDVQFVAPVRVGSGSVIGAGSTITKDVPENSLAVARTKQKVFPLRSGQGPAAKNEDR
ncbi:MAG: bifunctional UDP-N-acetylglucosamine diphosphorylase/glucosamine-1-phosphate N-acetyltransferase GlmU [Pseudomonadota bacterium]